MFDTHCHLNFSAFKKNLDEVIENAKDVGVSSIVIPGTDTKSSIRAVEIAKKYDGLYAAVGIHPHHIFSLMKEDSSVKILTQLNSFLSTSLEVLEQLVSQNFSNSFSKIVAIGEVGVDRHYYQKTKYENYQIDEKFIDLQKEFLKRQIELAIAYDKSLILHNREAKKDTLDVLTKVWDKKLEGRAVFHCCEPDEQLLEFAKLHQMFVGIDGDITYRKDKQEFVKKIPAEMLVLETDSPLLLPEPLRTRKLYPNEPKNLILIAEFIAQMRGDSIDKLITSTTENAKRLFQLPK